MDKFDENNLDPVSKAVFECIKADREPAQWKPPKWIWKALVAMKVAALTVLIALVAFTLNK